MLHEVLLVKCLEVALNRLRLDGLNRMSLNLRPGGKFESLIGILVGGFGFEGHWFVRFQGDNVSIISYLTDTFQHFVVLPQFLILLLGETLRIRGLTLERQRVDWVLRLLFVEDVLVSILPVGEGFLIA